MNECTNDLKMTRSCSRKFQKSVVESKNSQLDGATLGL